MWKTCGAFLVLIAVVVCEVDFDKEIKRLSRAPRDALPYELLKRVEKRNAEDHFCCRKKPIQIVRVSRAVARQKVVKEKVKVGEEACGFLGYSRCSIYDYEYKQVTYYETEYHHESKLGDCPKQNITCCNNFFYIKGLARCVALKDLKSVIEAVEKAKELERQEAIRKAEEAAKKESQ